MSHTGVEVFLYCKETYLRLLIAVWFGVFLQTPFVLWGRVAQVGVVAAVISCMVSVACRDQLDILSP